MSGKKNQTALLIFVQTEKSDCDQRQQLLAHRFFSLSKYGNNRNGGIQTKIGSSMSVNTRLTDNKAKIVGRSETTQCKGKRYVNQVQVI